MAGLEDRSIRELYDARVLEHARSPRNRRPLPGATARAELDNPFCGDRIAVAVLVEDDVLRDVAFEGRGCAIAVASASMMTERLRGHRVAEIGASIADFRALVREGAAEGDERVGPLAAFRAIAGFPGRIPCVDLPWCALEAALEGQRSRRP